MKTVLQRGKYLPPPSYRTVLVKGVPVELFEDGKPSSIAPMRVSLVDWADAGWYTAEEITRLHLVGVEFLPLYESEMVAKGLRWEEVE